jgi:hypothetical protein
VYTTRMTWQEIRELHPQQWLLFEVLEAESDMQTRYLKNLAVLERFDNSMTALRAYRDLKKTAPYRELLVLHTNRLEPTIQERHYVGIRDAVRNDTFNNGYCSEW